MLRHLGVALGHTIHVSRSGSARGQVIFSSPSPPSRSQRLRLDDVAQHTAHEVVREAVVPGTDRRVRREVAERADSMDVIRHLPSRTSSGA